MAVGTYSSQVDFRDFDVHTPWAAQFSSSSTSAGGGLFSKHVISFTRPSDFTDGYFDVRGPDLGITGGSQTTFTSGTVTSLRGGFTEGISTAEEFRITGASILATALQTAMVSADGTDDQALLRSIYRGADTITLSSFDDYAYGFGGNDTISGEGGNDRLFGQGGVDSVSGGAGLDTLSGGFGADRLNGGAAADVLRGNNGGDILTGGTGADIFEFRAGDDNDRITDWRDGVDEIRIYGPEGAITANIQELAGGDVRISVLGMNIIVENAVLADFQLITGSGFASLI
jgi:Ca2+-binding RTX toxin-like protein